MASFDPKMPRKKLKKFKEIEDMSNVIEPSKNSYHNIKGKWSNEFNNNNPIVLELACGYGNYTNGLAEVFEEKNFVGVDIKGERVWRGGNDALVKSLNNVRFLRCPIELIDNFFDNGEADEIWITFPDPRDKAINRRLTADKFLDIYSNILKKDGLIHLKTDSSSLFEWTVKVLESREDIIDLKVVRDFYESEFVSESFGIKTGYEEKYLALGVKIKYLQFSFK